MRQGRLQFPDLWLRELAKGLVVDVQQVMELHKQALDVLPILDLDRAILVPKLD
jgi:hypothetical protein